MKILLIGSGGREHALAWKLAQSPQVQTVYVAPGNGGTATAKQTVAGIQNLPISDLQELADFAKREKIHLTVVGPEAPLAAGIVDVFRKPTDCPEVLAESIEIGASSIWLQLGISVPEVEIVGNSAGLTVVMDRCIKIDYAAL